MATTPPVLLILGAGTNVGAGVAKAFAAKGYKVATTSRSQKGKEQDVLHIQSDLSNPSSVATVFAKVREAIGPPSVVVYNAGAATFNDPKDPLALPVEALTHDFAINTSSVLAAAHEATVAFKTLPAGASKTFIFTGNRLNIAPIAPLLGLGMGKSATAHLIASASEAYRDQGFKFYYADERKADGSPAFKVDGQAHGEVYAQLAEGEAQGPWLATFVKGSGRVDFP